jgi:radical SAM superfamily enzyme YgiQ (UPF0313 family)
MSKSLKIFLCDLTYDTVILVSDTIPINIGFIGSYAKSIFNENITVKLFKYPQETIDAIKKEKPDLICLSNYSWNSNLSEYVANIAKKANPNVVTAQGGPNLPHDDAQQIDFLRNRPSTDIFMIMEAEVTTANVINRIIDSNHDRKKIFSSPIDGAIFIDKNFAKGKSLKLFKGKPSERIKYLDEIPSPYLNGMLDHFFDGKLTPFIETNRGCPFRCSFCHTGDDYFNKIHKFSDERVIAEIDYIGKKAGNLSISNLHIADTNYGMYPRDREITAALLDSHNKYNWPNSIMATTGKNQKERVIDITSMLGNMFSVNMSAQSMDENVLSNIRRSNISLDAYKDINQHLKESGRSTKAELIMLLPGETKETFINGISEIIDSGIASLTIYTLMLLHGTEFKDPEYRKRFGYKGKFRIVPLNYGEYDSKKIFDYEEVAIQTNTTSFKEYLDLRGFALFVESLINGRPFDELFSYAEQFGISRTKIIKSLQDNILDAPNKVHNLYKQFIDETKDELWDSEEELVNHYRQEKNYSRLKKGLVGGNLIYKYKSASLLTATSEWIQFIEEQVFQLVDNQIGFYIETNELKKQLTNISKFCNAKLEGLFDLDSIQCNTTYNFEYDIIQWIDDIENSTLTDWKLNNPIKYTFGFSDNQMDIRKDQLLRYGSSINALSKLVTRISNLESQMKKIKTNGSFARDIYHVTKVGESFTRYTLAN